MSFSYNLFLYATKVGPDTFKPSNYFNCYVFFCLVKRGRPGNLQGLCYHHIGEMAAGDRGDGVRLGQHRDRQDRAKETRQNEDHLFRRRKRLRSHNAGSAQEEHGHVRPIVADTLCKTLSESPRVILREQG